MASSGGHPPALVCRFDDADRPSTHLACQSGVLPSRLSFRRRRPPTHSPGTSTRRSPPSRLTSSKSPPPPDKTTTLKDWQANGKRLAQNDRSRIRGSPGRRVVHSKTKARVWIESRWVRPEHDCERGTRIRPQQPQTHPLNPSATQFLMQGEAIAVCGSSTATMCFGASDCIQNHVLNSFLV